jgi:hypothetical protein
MSMAVEVRDEMGPRPVLRVHFVLVSLPSFSPSRLFRLLPSLPFWRFWSSLLSRSPFYTLVLGWRVSTARAASFHASTNPMSECLQVLIFVEEMKSPI